MDIVDSYDSDTLVVDWVIDNLPVEPWHRKSLLCSVNVEMNVHHVSINILQLTNQRLAYIVLTNQRSVEFCELIRS